MDIQQLRETIDLIDREIIKKLNERAALAKQIGQLKHKAGAQIYAPGREEKLLRKLIQYSDGQLLNEKAIRSIYREIISATIHLEKALKIAFLGPKGTFTHQAALKHFGRNIDYLPFRTIADVFLSVERKEVDYGVIPIENSTEGVVFHSLDLLAETDLKIISQTYYPISHCLLSHSPLEKIKKVYSKDIALGQCRQWLNRMLPESEWNDTDSTVQAVQCAQKEQEAAAVAGKLAAEIYNIPIVAENIQDLNENITRFLIISREPADRLGKGHDKSSFSLSLSDKPGALQGILTPFSNKGINLTKIESRPSKKKLWDYYFFIDIIGHYEDESVQQVLHEIKGKCKKVKWLGSYPNTTHS